MQPLWAGLARKGCDDPWEEGIAAYAIGPGGGGPLVSVWAGLARKGCDDPWEEEIAAFAIGPGGGGPLVSIWAGWPERGATIPGRRTGSPRLPSAREGGGPLVSVWAGLARKGCDDPWEEGIAAFAIGPGGRWAAGIKVGRMARKGCDDPWEEDGIAAFAIGPGGRWAAGIKVGLRGPKIKVRDFDPYCTCYAELCVPDQNAAVPGRRRGTAAFATGSPGGGGDPRKSLSCQTAARMRPRGPHPEC